MLFLFIHNTYLVFLILKKKKGQIVRGKQKKNKERYKEMMQKGNRETLIEKQPHSHTHM